MMARKKAEIMLKYQRLKDEYNITGPVLRELVKKNLCQAKRLTMLFTKDFTTYSKYFSAINEFLASSHTRLLIINTELEEFIEKNKSLEIVNKNETNKPFYTLNDLRAIINRSEFDFENNFFGNKDLATLLANSTIADNNTSSSESTSYLEYFDCCSSLLDLSSGNEYFLAEESGSNQIGENTDFFHEDQNQAFKELSQNEDYKSASLQIEEHNDIAEEIVQYEICQNLKTKNENECSSVDKIIDIQNKIPREPSVQESQFIHRPVEKQYTASEDSNLGKIIGVQKELPFLHNEISHSADILTEEIQLDRIKLQNLDSLQPSNDENVVDDNVVKVIKSVSIQSVEEKQDESSSNINKTDFENNCSVDVSEIKPEEIVNDVKINSNIEETIPIKVGDICAISFVNSPAEIYIQIANEISWFLDVMSDKLASICAMHSRKFSSKVDAMNEMGNFCCIKLNDQYFRVKVVNWLLFIEGARRDKVLIQLIDYGMKYEVNYSELFALPESYYSVYKMAQHCHFPYLYPPGSTEMFKLKEWPKTTREELENLSQNAIFKITHAYKCQDRDSYEIDIININETSLSLSVGQILINTKLAVEILDDTLDIVKNSTMIEQIRACRGVQGITPNMSRDDILEKFFNENVEEEVNNINEAVIHYNPRDEAETCRNLRKNGTCYKGKMCKFRHIKLQSGYTRDKEVIYKRAFNDPPWYSVNQEIMVTISHVIDIQRFYVQVRTENTINHTQTINDLIQIMNSPSMIKEYKKLYIPPCPGQLVLVHHWNSYWYRGQVLSVEIPERNEISVEVSVVDFGDTVTIPMSELRIMLPDFLELHFQAVECRLYNVKHKNGIDIEEEQKYFESHYLGQTFKAKVVASPDHLEILLYNNNGRDIGLQIIEDGFGDFNSEHNFPNSELILVD